MRKKRNKIVLAALIAGLCMCGCQREEIGSENVKNMTNTVTFTDDLGRTVSVESHERTAALLGSFADMWVLAGGETVASAEDAWTDFELPLPESAVNLGMTKNLSLEKLFEAEPDLVLASVNTRQNMEWKETLEAAGITTAYFDVSDFQDYLRVLKIFTEITGRDDLYEQNGAAIENAVEKVIKESKRHIEEAKKAPKILVLRASAGMIKAKNSKGNVLGELLFGLGCENIADEDESVLENLNLEHIMIEDPDFIFISQHGDDPEGIRKNMEAFISENPAWETLSAVKAGHVYYMEKDLYTLKPNDRWAEAYEKAEEILFHER